MGRARFSACKTAIEMVNKMGDRTAGAPSRIDALQVDVYREEKPMAVPAKAWNMNVLWPSPSQLRGIRIQPVSRRRSSRRGRSN